VEHVKTICESGPDTDRSSGHFRFHLLVIFTPPRELMLTEYTSSNILWVALSTKIQLLIAFDHGFFVFEQFPCFLKSNIG